jgi:hypothetical protein
MRDVHYIIEAVQANCDIADARHARELTLCNYLLGMRELYRWEHELPFTYVLSKSEIGAWLARREEKWNGLEREALRPVPVAGQAHDPFDSATINRLLTPHGLVYGGGYGRWGAPVFFLAQLERQEDRSGLAVLVSGCEYARGLAAPPAALNNGTVFLRMDAMQRWLWGKFETWGVHQADDALKAALDCYGAGETGTKLARMATHESETLILHEVGESLAEPLLGTAWHEMLASFSGRRAELLVRAVRDNLADCLSTLPELIRRGERCSLHFYFANFDGLRHSLFPRLAQGYQRWRESGSDAALAEAVAAGRAHWEEAALRLLQAWRDDPAKAETVIERMDEGHASLAL